MSSPEDSSFNHNNPTSSAGNGEGAAIPTAGSNQNLNVEIQEEGADYLYSNIFTFENGPAYKALSNQQEKLNPEKFKRLQKALENIYSFVMDSIQSEKNLVKTSKELSHKLQSITTDFEKQTSQSYHDNSTLGDLKRELLKTQNEVSLCQEKETKYISELQQNEKQRAELLADIEQIRQHKVDMLEPQLVATNKELRMDILQRKQQLENLKKDYDEKREVHLEIVRQKEKLDLEKEKYSTNLTKASEIPPKMMKQNEVLKEAIQSLQIELVRQNQMGTQLETEIVKVVKRRQELEKDRTDLQGQLEMRFLQIEAMEAQTDEIFKNHELAKEQLTIQKQEKIRLDTALKKTIQDIAKEHDLLLRTFREKENAIKLHIRLENQLLNIRNIKPKFEKQKEDLERELTYQQQENKFSRNNIRTARQEIDLIIYQYLQQEISDANQREVLENNQQKISKLEGQLIQAQAEQHAANQQLYSVNIERDLKARDLTKVTQKFKHAKEEIRIKTSQAKDCEKRAREVQNQLKSFTSLYDTVKAERNKYVNLIQSSVQKTSEIKEKIKILGNEMDILRNEYANKDKELTKKLHEGAALLAIRDSLRHDVNKNTLAYREKKNQMDQKVSLLESFCHVINSSEAKLQQLKSDYEMALKSRNNTAMQLLERQEELCVLYEKINIHASFMKKGEFSLRQKEEEIRISKLAIQELKREINLLKKKEPIQHDQVEEIKKLRHELDAAKKTVTDLSNQLESPINNQRSRHLEGRDPNEIELEKKLRSLEEKIADKEEVLLEKDLILDEITKLTIRLKEQTKENQKIAIETNQKINKIQIQLKDINMSMMALVSELSLSQAQSIQFENEKSEKVKILEEATDRYSKGEVPLPEFEYEYMRGEKQKMIRHEQFLKSRAEMEEEEFSHHLVKPRPNAYIVQHDLPLPKPYGNFAPFKPTDPGSNMRHYHKPKPKPIEL